MKRFTLPVIFLLIATVSSAQLNDTKWLLASLGVGPTDGDVSWWAYGMDGTRECFENDTFIFSADGTFEIVFGTETWVEQWQSGVAEACGAPIAPFDGSNAATWAITGDQLTITGVGSYLTLPKATNTGEISDPANAPASVTYKATFNPTEDVMSVSCDYTAGFWQATYAKISTVSIRDYAVQSLSVYPTVASDYITVDAKADKYVIINTVGKVVKTAYKSTIEVNDLASGMYFVRVPEGVAKFIVK